MPQTNNETLSENQSSRLHHHQLLSGGERSKRSSRRYLKLLKAYCLKYKVLISNNVFNQSGRLLLRKGLVLSDSLVEHLYGQHLVKPLAACIKIKR